LETSLGFAIKLFYAALAFGILIFIHELGHFLMAKAMGVRVLTFALGFGKKLVTIRRGGTDYALCAVPLGGYVKMLGEDPEEEVSSDDLLHSFSNKGVAKRFIIVLAGPAFNLLLAMAIIWFLYLGEVPYVPTRIHQVQEGSPAAAAGLQSGDLIVAIDGRSVRRFHELRERIMSSDGAAMEFSVNRDGNLVRIRVTPRARVEVGEYGDEIRHWQIGVVPVAELAVERFGPWDAFTQASRWTWEKSAWILTTVGRLFTGRESIKNVGSPLLIGAVAAKQAEKGLADYFSYIALISVILAVMNLLPIPVLDGSHLLFFLIEGVAGKPISKRVLGVAQYVGLGILVCIMAWAIYRDVDRFYWKAKQGDKPALEAPQTPAPAPEKP
jgi:regulator of sigma E protease